MVCASLGLALVLAQTPPQEVRETRLAGTVKRHAAVASKHFPYKRNLIVYLPPDYEASPKRTYPVFLMHDGQNLMDGATSFLPNKEWRVDEAAETLIRAGLIEPIIIVGIDNAGAERSNEYIPWLVKRTNGSFGGRADKYEAMVVDEILPMLRENYRIKSGPANTALGGSSFGGVITQNMGLRRPDVFGKLALVSPSVWVNDLAMVKQVEALPKAHAQRIWIDIGTAESPDAVEHTEALAAAYRAKKFSQVALLIDPQAGHNEDAWARRFPQILLYFFGSDLLRKR